MNNDKTAGLATAPRGKLRYMILFMLFMVTTFNYADRAILSIAGTAMKSELGFDWVLGPSTSYTRRSFDVVVGVALTDEQRKRLRKLVVYMKPLNTHLIRISEPEVPLVVDHLELGLSELGDEFVLH